MSDLVEREKVIRYLRDRVSLDKFMKRTVSKADESCLLICDGIIENVPTVDAEPVRHGCWKPARVVDDCFWVCSSCEFPSEASGANILYKYCPVCGAKMDAQETEE